MVPARNVLAGLGARACGVAPCHRRAARGGGSATAHLGAVREVVAVEVASLRGTQQRKAKRAAKRDADARRSARRWR